MEKFEDFLRNGLEVPKDLNQPLDVHHPAKNKRKLNFFDSIFDPTRKPEQILEGKYLNSFDINLIDRDAFYILSAESMIEEKSKVFSQAVISESFFLLETIDIEAFDIHKIASLGFAGILCDFSGYKSLDLARVTLIFETCRDFGLWAALNIFEKNLRKIYFDSDICFSYLDVNAFKSRAGDGFEPLVAEVLDDFRFAKTERRIPRALFLVDKKTSSVASIRTEITRIDL